VLKEALAVEVGRHGAFSVNSIGLNGTPFPLSFSVREASGSWMVDATAAQAGELADVLIARPATRSSWWTWGPTVSP
jgi:hypothetical protein